MPQRSRATFATSTPSDVGSTPVRAPAFVAAVASLVLGASTHVWAYPFLQPRPVPDAIAGPTDPHPAAAFYNPAALGFLRGVHLFLDGAADASFGSIKRDGSASSTTIASASPQTFAGLTWDLGTDSFDLGLAVYTPFSELSSYPTSSPVRYQEQYQRFASLEETFAAAWKIENHIAVGAGLIIDENWIDYGYAHDLAPAGGSALVSQANELCGGAACGYENPLAQQNVKLRGYATGIGFTVGAVGRPVDRLWLGLSYTSHQTGGDLFMTSTAGARVKAAPGQGGYVAGGDDRVVMLLPEMIQAGVRIQATPTLDIEAQWRFVHYGARHELDVSLQGGGIATTGIASGFALDRGLQNSYMIEVSTRHQITPYLRLSPSLALETSAVAADAVSAAALDAPKLDAALTFEWRVWRSGLHSVQVGGHAGVTGYFVHHVDSRFNSQAEVSCVDAQYSLAACAQLDAGSALPSASGDYTLVVVNLGASVGFSY